MGVVGLKIIIDIEANALINPTHIWVIVCKDIDSGEYYTFRNLHEPRELDRWLGFAKRCDLFIGHNYIGYDGPNLERITGHPLDIDRCLDTLILSRMYNYSRSGHSIEDYGLEFGFEKIKYNDFSKYSPELETYCRRDVDICHRIYTRYRRYVDQPSQLPAIALEHQFQVIADQIGKNGFAFNKDKASKLLTKVEVELKELDVSILEAFPPRLRLIKEYTPKETKYGTINLTSVPRSLRDHIPDMCVGGTFCYCEWKTFNPSSHKQIIEVLNAAGWKPTDKTKSHIEAIRQRHEEKVKLFEKTGWKVNEANLETLPPSAPVGARLLGKRITLESRRRTLTEWLALANEDGRIHGKFFGIGAWTHRMAHQNPNTANIPNELDTQGKKKLYGKELRSLWRAPAGRLLVGVDAEGIQLRIFAHLIDDPEFTDALIKGKKEDKSDPHSLNQSILGSVCRSRQAAKRYIYALLLGAGKGKLREILDCSDEAAEAAYQRLLQRYTGFAYLKDKVIPRDAKRGWFIGLDGRRVPIPGDTDGARRHLAMSGYLQNGEAVVMKLACRRFLPLLPPACLLVNFVHDEWQTEVPNDMEIALRVASLQADSLRIVGEELGLKCPLAGSYWNDDLKDYTIAMDWSKTH